MNLHNLGVNVLDKVDITALESILLNDNKELQVVPYEYLKDFSQNEISLFCVKHGFYVIPTIELLLFLQKEIDNDLDSTIEIGAGHGAISRTLKIRAYDNFMQQDPEVKAYYELLRQATVPYGAHVHKMDGNEAIRTYSPKYVIGAYCTHKYNPEEQWRGGNKIGFEEEAIIKQVKKYIHIGNEDTHKNKPILKHQPREVKADWILTRSADRSKNVIWIWE